METVENLADAFGDDPFEFVVLLASAEDAVAGFVGNFGQLEEELFQEFVVVRPFQLSGEGLVEVEGLVEKHSFFLLRVAHSVLSGISMVLTAEKNEIDEW